MCCDNVRTNKNKFSSNNRIATEVYKSWAPGGPGTKFSFAEPNICVSSVWNLHYDSRISRKLINSWNEIIKRKTTKWAESSQLTNPISTAQEQWTRGLVFHTLSGYNMCLYVMRTYFITAMFCLLSFVFLSSYIGRGRSEKLWADELVYYKALLVWQQQYGTLIEECLTPVHCKQHYTSGVLT
jgi:hypothetical protein